MPVVGVMPFPSSAPVSSSGVRWLPVLSQGGLPWWEEAVGEGSGKSSSNKLDGVRVPDLEEEPRLVLCSISHHGGGDGEGKKWSSWIQRLGSASLSSASDAKELRRPLQLWAFLRGQGRGGSAPVFDASPVTFLAEGRPTGASASAPFLPPGLDAAYREAVRLKLRVHPRYLRHRLMLLAVRWRFCCPKWFVPRDGRVVSELRSFGPNCDLGSRFRVFLAYFRDLVVILVLFCPDVSLVPALLHY